MTTGMNKVFLMGNLGADPELSFTAAGIPVANFSLATSESWRDASGQRQEKTEWHRVVVWGAQGEACARFLSKGARALVEGRIATRSWTDKDGAKHFRTEIVASKVTFLDSRAQRPLSSGDIEDWAAEREEAGPDMAMIGALRPDDDVPF